MVQVISSVLLGWWQQLPRDRPLAPPWQDDFEVPMAPGAVNVLDDILGEGEGLDFDATSPRVGAER